MKVWVATAKQLTIPSQKGSFSVTVARKLDKLLAAFLIDQLFIVYRLVLCNWVSTLQYIPLPSVLIH